VSEEIYVNFQHCRSLGLCLHGLRRFCTKHDLDFKDFRDGKMTISTLRATGEVMWTNRLEQRATAHPIGEPK
jgi:hypothetical protein